MLKLSVLGLAIAVFCLASPCQALDPDVTQYPASSATSGTELGRQILGLKDLVVGTHADPNYPGPDPNPDAYLADSHTSNPLTFGNLSANSRASGIMTLDKFDPTRILQGGTDPVGELRGVLLVLTVRLTSGRVVVDNEGSTAIGATIHNGAKITVSSEALVSDLVKKPYMEVIGNLAKDAGGPYDGMFPGEAGWNDANIDLYSTGTDKLAAIIRPDSPDIDGVNYFQYTDLITDLTDPDNKLALFVGPGTIDFDFSSSPYQKPSFGGTANAWSTSVTFDIQARLVYLYADAAVPEPASMGLLAAAFAPVLLRRFRGKIKAL